MGRLRDKIQGASMRERAPLTCELLRGQCPQCQGRGYLLAAEQLFVSARLCDCVESCAACYGSNRLVDSKGVASLCRKPAPKEIVAAFNGAQIPARYLDAELSEFRNFSGNGQEIFQRIQKWLGEFRVIGGPGLLLSGGVGVGKTYLLCGIAKQYCRLGYNVRFIDFHRLLSLIRAAYSDQRSEESILQPLIRADLLIVDELGKGRNSDWEQEKLDQIVMGRYSQNKVIVASTNYELKKAAGAYQVSLDQNSGNKFSLEGYESLESRVGRRIYSRLAETSLFLSVQGSDFRARRSVQSKSRS